MKHRMLTLICILALSLCSTVACASGKLLPDLKKQDGLTSVYVGKALLNMAGVTHDMGLPGVDMMSMGRNLDSIEIISAETPSTAKYLRQMAIEAVNKIKDLELAMENNEDGRTSTQIYVKPSADGLSYTRLILLVSDVDEYTVIDMKGIIPLNAINSYY